MSPLTRRQFFQVAAATLAGSCLAPSSILAAAMARRFTLDLTPGAIGISGELPAIIQLAKTHGFESVQPDPAWLARQDTDALRRTRGSLDEMGLKWGAAALPVEFRRTDEVFKKDLSALPRAAEALQAVGATRCGTWISPGHNELSYADNLTLHATRLREVATVLRDHGIRLGLEYVGTPSLRRRFKHLFVYNLAGTRELLGAIRVPGTGVLPDSWHWWTAGDTVASLSSLRNEDIVAVDLNDAPAGIPLEEQQDNRRELPATTGVIPVKEFLTVLLELGYDGPVRAEPFNSPLNALDNEPAAAKTIEALKRALKLVKG